MNNSWKPSSWRNKPAKHIPQYENTGLLNSVTEELKKYPPLVFAGESRNL